MPKVELHVHLEGAISPDVVWDIALRNHASLPARSLDEWRTNTTFRDFGHFVEAYDAVAGVLSTAGDFFEIAERFCATQAASNIRHTEAFLSTSMHLSKLSADTLADALAQGIRKGRSAHGVSVLLIPDISRHLPETAKPVLDFALKAHRRFPDVFVGLGLGGKESGFSPERFEREFREARNSGMHAVAHAGESAGSESIRGALDVVRAERIGHGIRCLEDPGVVTLLRERAVPLEVCPVSNYRTNSCAEGQPHPIRRMLDAGLRCTVSSDDPALFSTSLAGEYTLLAAQGFTWDELHEMNVAAVHAAFIEPSAKEKILTDFAALQ